MSGPEDARDEASRASGPHGHDVPAATIERLANGRPIVVLAPHPDDETLGCGALLAGAFESVGACVVCVTDGSRSHPDSRAWPPARLAAERARELAAAVIELGGEPGDIVRLDLPDGAVPGGGVPFEAAVETIASLCRELDAACLYATSPADSHADHRATAAIADAVVRRLPALRLLHYPIWSRQRDADWFEKASRGVEVHRLPSASRRAAKRRAIARHRSQLGELVRDDPGFVLPPDMIERFVTEDEWFFEPHRS